jgi:hypothetical protein
MLNGCPRISQLPPTPLSERLNRECACVTLDRDALCGALEREVI